VTPILSPTRDVTVSPLVSVVTIFLNAERFMQAAIESVFAQSHQDWELLLVDDGSTDRSTGIAQRYAAAFPEQVRYLEHPGHRNAGMSASRNLGIRQARGRYVAFLDADDVWLSHKLGQQIAIMEANSTAAMIFGTPRYWYSWTGNPADVRRDRTRPPGAPSNRLYHPPELALRLYPLGHGSAPCPSDLLIRRSALADVGLFEESFRGANQLYEDQAFLAKVYLHGAVYVADACWTRYRQHPESCVEQVRRSGQYDDVRRYFLEWLERYLNERGRREVRVWLALQCALAQYRHPTVAGVPKAARRSLRATRMRARRAVQRLLPTHVRSGWATMREALDVWRGDAVPRPGSVRFGSMRRPEPFSRQFGFDRGLPIDRHYIEQFLALHAADVQGRVLEIGDDTYSCQFGGERVEACDILHVDDTNPQATIVGDLSQGDAIPSSTFDCVILTQTLHLIFDLAAAVRTIHRILKPGGVVLATVPGITQIADDQWGDSWYWGFTSLSAHRAFAEQFDPTLVVVDVYGNVLAASAFLHGLAAHELRAGELARRDAAYQVIVGVRAVKPRITPS
jgi:glycosyltransferase involved in cell wall biosynthesis